MTEQADMAQTCKCGRGKVSRFDGKCGHCRSRKEQKAHDYKIRHNLYPALVTYQGEF